MGGVLKKVFGGNTRAVQGSNFAPRTDEENRRLQQIEGEIDHLFGDQGTLNGIAQDQSSEIQNLFANNLKTFLTNGTNPTPEDIANASAFVDQTFTNPSQQVLKQQQQDFSDQARATAASLGRDPNADIATQQAIAGESMRQGIGLQAERGARIQQATSDQFTRGLQGLQAGQQGSGFLNDLSQRAFTNRMGLLNARSGLADFYQKERSKTSINQATSSPGLLGYQSAIAKTVGNSAKAAGSILALGAV